MSVYDSTSWFRVEGENVELREDVLAVLGRLGLTAAEGIECAISDPETARRVTTWCDQVSAVVRHAHRRAVAIHATIKIDVYAPVGMSTFDVRLTETEPMGVCGSIITAMDYVPDVSPLHQAIASDIESFNFVTHGIMSVVSPSESALSALLRSAFMTEGGWVVVPDELLFRTEGADLYIPAVSVPTVAIHTDVGA